MQKSMIMEIRSYMEAYKMLRPGDRVIAAVSGGADSVCLLWALQKIAPEFPAFLRVVHVHHGLRGAEADRDERFVEELCRKLGIPFQTVRCNAAEYARDHGMSTEEAGRVLRYEALEQAAECWEKETGAVSDCPVKIAVAHHREDSAETVLHNLLRGSGLRGLSGIRPVQGRLIRPLLSVSREEICAWLEAEGVSWCEDSTNQSEEYTRNVIRRRILPLMRETVNQRAEENILRAADIMAQADRYLEQQAESGRQLFPDFCGNRRQAVSSAGGDYPDLPSQKNAGCDSAGLEGYYQPPFCSPGSSGPQSGRKQAGSALWSGSRKNL